MGGISTARAQARALGWDRFATANRRVPSKSRRTTPTPRRATTRAGIRLRDGSVATLPSLLDGARRDAAWRATSSRRHGRHWPLLPKTLDVAELLSVQAHPPGNTEVYVIVAADPGATLRLGFRTDVDAKSFATRVAGGSPRPAAAATSSAARRSATMRCRALLKPWLSDRGATPPSLEPRCGRVLDKTLDRCRERAARVARRVLAGARPHERDSGHARPGLHNATPAAHRAASGRPRSAEIHALGNTEGRTMLALEIRKPGSDVPRVGQRAVSAARRSTSTPRSRR